MRKQIARTRNQGTEHLRQSAMTAILDDADRRFDFKADAYLVRHAAAEHMATTGERMEATAGQSFESSSDAGLGKVYKFKNIHGDRGTYAGLSSKAQDPPSSIWK